MLVHQRTSSGPPLPPREDDPAHPDEHQQGEGKEGRLSPVLGTQDIPKDAAPICHAGPVSQGTQHHRNNTPRSKCHPGQGSRQPLEGCPRRNLDSRSGGCLPLPQNESSPSPRAQEKHLKKEFFFFLRTLCRDCADQAEN